MTDERAWWWSAARTAITAALAAAVGSVAVAVLCWLPDAGTVGHPLSAVRAGLLAMLAGHHGGVTVDGVPAALLPLGILIALLWIAHRAGLALATEPKAHPAALIAVQTVTYAACCLLLVPLAELGTSHVALVPTGLSAALVFAVGSAGGFLRAGTWDVDLPEPLRLGLVGLGVYLAGGAVLVGGSLIAHAHDVLQLSRQVGGGLSGLPVLVLGVLSAPNAVVSGSAYLSGPGFAVGAGSTFTPFSGGHGVEPAFPLLGALPGGPAPVPMIALLALTVLGAGVLVGHAAWVRGPAADVSGALLTAVGAALTTGFGLALLAGLAGGGLGDGRLRTVGASPWLVGLVVPGEIAVGSLLTIATLWTATRIALARAADAPAAEEPVGADR